MKKQLNRTEIIDKTIKYLNSKGISIAVKEDEIVWNYEPHYSKFRIKLYLEKKNWSDEQPNLIKYYVNSHVRGIGRRKNTISDGYCLKVYRTLMWIKDELDKVAEEEKNKIEQKTKYCTELESYYNKLYKRVSISTSKNGEMISINISCTDNNSYVNYNMTYKDNKYYLNNRLENYETPITFNVE